MEGRVMVYHDHAVGRQMDVQFDTIRAVFERSPESGEGVLGVLPRRPAVGYDFQVAPSVRRNGVGSH
jgi:hypothetical protein